MIVNPRIGQPVRLRYRPSVRRIAPYHDREGIVVAVEGPRTSESPGEDRRRLGVRAVRTTPTHPRGGAEVIATQVRPAVKWHGGKHYLAR